MPGASVSARVRPNGVPAVLSSESLSDSPLLAARETARETARESLDDSRAPGRDTGSLSL